MTDGVPQRGREARIAARRLEECEARIEESRRAARWHGIFAVIGVSPASLIPMVGLGLDFGAIAIVGASAFVVSLETWRYFRARSEVREGEAERDRLRALMSGPPGASRGSAGRTDRGIEDR